jgi:hypothetical protein
MLMRANRINQESLINRHIFAATKMKRKHSEALSTWRVVGRNIGSALNSGVANEINFTVAHVK